MRFQFSGLVDLVLARAGLLLRFERHHFIGCFGLEVWLLVTSVISQSVRVLLLLLLLQVCVVK